MATGLMALLDDVAAIAKLAAASVDDALGQAAKAGTKAAGVVIDDAAVTPKYVVGLSPQRELPMIWKITLGSLRNKLVFLLPLALALDYLATWLITPLLMAGGIYLCYEGAEKLLEYVSPHAAHQAEEAAEGASSAAELERQKVAGAIRTDFILSAEIMAITLANISDAVGSVPSQGLVPALFAKAVPLAIVAVGITVVVYGVVGLIVKADDIGLAMARTRATGLAGRMLRAVGVGIVKGMPGLLAALAAVGTAAMLWVGGSILIHGLSVLGFHLPEESVHHVSDAAGSLFTGKLAATVAWLAATAVQGVLGVAVGAAFVPVVGKVISPLARAVSRLRGQAA